jgi:two-component system sensor histidine kinase EvgS
VIQAGSEIDFPPYAIVDAQGRASGFSVELLQAVADAAELDVRVTTGPWPEVLQGFKDGRYDVLPLVALSPQRKDMAEYTRPHTMAYDCFFVRKGSPPIASIKGAEGREVIVMTSDAAHEALLHSGVPVHIVETKTIPEAMQLLASGRHDAVLVPRLLGQLVLRDLKLAGIIEAGTPVPDYNRQFAFAVRPGDPRLRDQLDHGIAVVQASGRYGEIYRKWFHDLEGATRFPWYLLAWAGGSLVLLAVLGSGWFWSYRQQQKLVVSEERFRGAFQYSAIGMALISPEGRWLRVNPAICSMLGYTEAELRAITFQDITYPEDLDADLDQVRRMLAGEIETYSMEKRYLHRQGSIVWALLTVSLLRDVDGGALYFVSQIQDFTGRKQAEDQRAALVAQLQQAQKMESIGRLAGGVAHDFNNMLGVILGHAELGLTRVEPSDPVCADLNDIRKAAERSADLTRQLLAFARRQVVAPRVLAVNEAVAGLLKMLQRLIGEDIELCWLPATGIWPVRMDPSQLDQVLANLCVNARDAIAGMGRVTITTANVTVDEADGVARVDASPGDYVRIAVSDDGQGIDADVAAHIFEPFYTTKEHGKGTGLGLATVYGAVRQNNGFITVASEPGHGATFSIHLPRHAAADGASPVADAVVSNPRGTETILLVEDEEAMLSLAGMLLEQLGYRVLPAGSPDAALRFAQEHGSAIDLLLTDVIMPEMDGKALACSVRVLRPSIKLMYMSGYTADVIAPHGVLDGATHFIQKPFRFQELAAKVREALDKG